MLCHLSVVAALVLIAGLAAGSPWLFPTILDAAANRGELILDSPESAVAVTVMRGGQAMGVLDPEARRRGRRVRAERPLVEIERLAVRPIADRVHRDR